MKTIFMGTPDFAARALEAIIKKGHEVVAVYTQPDKPKGRSKKLIPSEVKVMAEKYDIPVYQPVKLREAENVEKIKEIDPEIIVVAAYGQILPLSILEIPKYGCINIHASLLPKYRGAAPIERCIIDGEEKTGVTTMYMAEGLDTGDMIESVETPITAEDTGLSLTERLSDMGAELIISTMEKLEGGTAKRTPQDDSKSNYAKMLDKAMGQLDFNKTAVELERLIRGLIPWPCCYTTIEGKSAKILKAEVVCGDSNAACGEIIEVTKKYFVINCKEGALKVLRITPEGKKEMDTAAFLNGNHLEKGIICGE